MLAGFINKAIENIRGSFSVQGVINALKHSPLMIAVLNQQSEIARLLLEKNSLEINKHAGIQGETPLHIAVLNGNLKTINILLSYGANINSRTFGTYSVPVLHYALVQAYYQATNHSNIASFQIIELLLRHNAEVNILDYRGSTALIVAAALGLTDVVQLLLEYKADHTIATNDGETALSIAQGKQYTNIADILKSHTS